MRDIHIIYLFDFIRYFNMICRRRSLDGRAGEAAARAAGNALSMRDERALRASGE
jgi:hypothetical protein